MTRDDVVVVPREPTEAMIEEAQDQADAAHSVCLSSDTLEVVWRAMISASPSASADRGGLREKVARIVLDAVYSGFEHSECDKEWEPDYGKEIAGLSADAIMALVPPALQQKGEET